MKEMSERIQAMDQITQNMDREFKSSRVVSTIGTTSPLVSGIVTEDFPVSSLRSKRLSFHFSRGQNRKSRSSSFRGLSFPRNHTETLAAQASRSAAGQLLTIFLPSLVIVPKLFAKVNLAQSTFPFQSGESVCNFTYHKHSLSFYNPRQFYKEDIPCDFYFDNNWSR